MADGYTKIEKQQATPKEAQQSEQVEEASADEPLKQTTTLNDVAPEVREVVEAVLQSGLTIEEIHGISELFTKERGLLVALETLGQEGVDAIFALVDDSEAMRASKIKIISCLNHLGAKRSTQNIVLRLGLIIHNLERIRGVLTRKII